MNPSQTVNRPLRVYAFNILLAHRELNKLQRHDAKEKQARQSRSFRKGAER